MNYLDKLKMNSQNLYLYIVLLISVVFYGMVASGNWDLAFGFVMICIALYVFLLYAKKDIFHPIGIYSLFWLGISGLATYRVTTTQESWSNYMKLIIVTSYITFIIGFNLYKKFSRGCNSSSIKTNPSKLYIGISALTVFSVIAFLAEVAILKYIPLFSENMSAYRDFHVTGIHYFVVMVGILPAISLLYKKLDGKHNIIWINLISFAISTLIVSRQLIILQVILLIITYHYVYRKISFKSIFIIGIIGLALFSVSFSMRNQSSDYFNQAAKVSEQHKDNPMVKPFLYFTYNFENLRNTVENFNDFKYGTNMAFPILAFTNTKGMVDYSYKSEYFTNPNMNTSTYLADIYYDFGFVGVVIVPFLLGMLYSFLYEKMRNSLNSFSIIFMLLTYCLIFCFFVNWYINTSIVFDIVILILLGVFTIDKNKKVFRGI